MKFRNIGDVLLITPLISNLKYNFPDATIDIALNKGTEEMITLNPNVNEVIIYDREKIKVLSFIKKFYSEIKFGLFIRKKQYDLIINTTKGERGTQLALISGAKTKIGYKSKNIFFKKVFNFIIPPQLSRHVVESNLDVLRTLGLPINDKKVEIFWDKKDEIQVDKLVGYKNFIHIHPVSRWLFKCVDDKTIAKIIDYCEITLKNKVVLTCAPLKQELDKIQSILSHCQSQPMILGGKLSLKECAYLNSKARFFIGVDTAIMHISAANNTPVLAFFGPSGSDHWGPWDNDLMESGYLKNFGNQKMGKHTVIQRDWDCVPCSKAGCDNSKISECLINIDMNLIIKSINENMHV